MQKLACSPAVCVQGTNDSSVVSKCSMVKKGYFEDPFIEFFVCKHSRRSPLINRGYYVRAKAIETIVDLFLDSCRNHDCTSTPVQIVSLGAGFDSLYFRIAAKRFKRQATCSFENIVFIEMDFTDVVCRKSQIIRSHDELRDLIENDTLTTGKSDGGIVLNSSKYKLIGLDLCDLSNMSRQLRECQVDFQSPTIFLSECAITYMNVNSSNDLIRWASSNFLNSMFAVYEQILPSDGFGQVMCRHFAEVNASLRSIHEYPDADSQRRRYQNLGWSSCDTIDMNTFIEKMIPAEEIVRIDGLELFEEFEEFHAKCSHYVLMVATKGTVKIDTLPAARQFLQAKFGLFPVNVVLRELDECGIIKRFGHRSEGTENMIITVGGFGVSIKGGHSRLKDICVTDRHRRTDFLVPMTTENLKSGRLFHSLSRLSDGRFVMIGGRGSPVEPHSDIVVFNLIQKRSFSAVDEVMSVHVTVAQPAESQQQQIRWRHSATVMHVNGREGIFIFGGRNVTSSTLGDCHILYTDTWQWKQVSVKADDPCPCARHSHSSCRWETEDEESSTRRSSRIVVSGGLDVHRQPLADIYIFDSLKSRWSRLETTTPLLPRYSQTSHVWKNKLILLGGVNAMATNPPGIGIVDLTIGDVCEITLSAMSKPFLFNKHSSALDDKTGEIVILGGGGTCFSFGTHFNQSAFVFDLKDPQLSELLRN